ncbi:glycerophosphoryl diester phosphodiesterase [Loktanella ponticola]|uniref:Glycerophosphoryl diester phosphodiesterase n=1 Tax=Yoonia ponticola TaxID=1524255 RepID=A0A7W9BLZ3_9RHOB|nr:glycerophosphodiester phosphodiesterase family protein [Yoonia ponticola]MBB5723013.1 glycerophosphoryl diester phosphodiesterase [Yoonia ponticola]
MKLPASFLTKPITHRALHDKTDGRPENSIEAITAAIDAGYGIEIDLQLSQDGVPMVFHDYHLGRLTAETGPVAMRTAAELGQIMLTGGATGIPTFAEVLALVNGRVPLLVEIKDQDHQMGENVGLLQQVAADALADYKGDVAIMSFNPHAVMAFGVAAPTIPRGIVTSDYTATDWPTIPADVRDRLRDIPDYDRIGASFISHEARDLGRDRVANLKAAGANVLCWTIKSPEQEAEARKVADNVTFEGYLA